MKASEQQALIPQEATPDTLIDLIDDLRRSLNMEDGDVEASIDPDTGEIG